MGIVSGCNKIFERDMEPSIMIMGSDYIKTKKKRKFIFADNLTEEELAEIYPETYKYLKKYKAKLLNRRVRKFNESNWYKWGSLRNIKSMKNKKECIFVNLLTRNNNPFYIEKMNYFDGTVVCLEPKKKIDLNYWTKYLNSIKDQWRIQNILVGTRYGFHRRALENFILIDVPV